MFKLQPFVELQDRIGYRFKEPDLLVRAMTHRSYRNENREIPWDNERLEFLGDAVLSVIVATLLWQEYPDEDEGSMTRARASLVSEETLARCARRLDLGRYLLLGRGEDGTGGRDRDSVLADAFEAMVGAIFVDGGSDVASKMVLAFLAPELSADFGVLADRDPRSRLQERAQALGYGTPQYKVIRVTGPTHEPAFVVEVQCAEGRFKLRGRGGTKKSAATDAATRLLETLPES
ncbi:MAG: ribonuclease III [Pseudomonadota bacterium]